MPYRIRWEPHGVYRAYLGDVTDAERRESLERICADTRFDGLRYAITDFLAVETLQETRLSAIEAAAQNIEPLATNTRIVLAAVATDPRHRNYILRVMSAGFISAPYEFFPSVARARQWIAETADVPVAQQAGASSFEP